MTNTNLLAAFEKFHDQCVWLHICRNTFLALYQSDESTDAVLRRSANAFFFDLNIILSEYYILQVCKLTDPAESNGRKNLTTNYLNSELELSGLITDEIRSLCLELEGYRKLVVKARNKIISHSDANTAIHEILIGEHAIIEVVKFFKALQKYRDSVAVALGLTRCDISGTGCAGDVYDLIKVLKTGLGMPIHSHHQ